MHSLQKYKFLKKRLITLLLFVFLITFGFTAPVYAFQCGGGKYAPVVTSINFGCSGKGNPIDDLLFAVIRLLADGVGIVVIGSVIVAGIQYSVSADSPDGVQKARGRLQTTIVALFIFIFTFAILNFLIPGGYFT